MIHVSYILYWLLSLVVENWAYQRFIKSSDKKWRPFMSFYFLFFVQLVLAAICTLFYNLVLSGILVW